MVVDADCLIAGTLTPSGATTELLDLWRSGEFELIVCPQLLHEVRKALRHPRIARRYNITAEETEAFVGRLSQEGILLEDPTDPPRVVPDDPKDDYLVALALAASADALVTRDRHFAKVRAAGLAVLAPREWLRRVGRR